MPRSPAPKSPTIDLLARERELWSEGLRSVCGIDEAGRGPLAGPVVAACVILPNPNEFDSQGINDSKKLTERQREAQFARLTADPLVTIGVGIVDAAQIDSENILRATHSAMRLALARITSPIERILVDGLPIKGLSAHPQEAIVGGDARVASIAGASIIAKVTRDRMMKEYDALYPGYGFAGHKGYGSATHLEALRALGPCPIHRHSFAPVAAAAGNSTGKSSTDTRKQAGNDGEAQAAELLAARGYTQVIRNVRPLPGLARGEIDIVAWDGEVLCFIEVKTRRTRALPPDLGVTPGKRRQIVMLAEAYLSVNKLEPEECRFDVVSVWNDPALPCPMLALHQNAFEPE